VSANDISTVSANAKIMSLPQSLSPTNGQLMPALPRISRDLDKASGWLTELASIYRSARRGQLATDDASRLAYLCSQAGRLAKDVQELKELAQIRDDLQSEPQHVPQIDYTSSDADAATSVSVIEDIEAQS
jgi:hypothetical protein